MFWSGDRVFGDMATSPGDHVELTSHNVLLHWNNLSPADLAHYDQLPIGQTATLIQLVEHDSDAYGLSNSLLKHVSKCSLVTEYAIHSQRQEGTQRPGSAPGHVDEIEYVLAQV